MSPSLTTLHRSPTQMTSPLKCSSAATVPSGISIPPAGFSSIFLRRTLSSISSMFGFIDLFQQFGILLVDGIEDDVTCLVGRTLINLDVVGAIEALGVHCITTKLPRSELHREVNTGRPVTVKSDKVGTGSG